MARVFHLDTDEHQTVQSLLPWFANGTLADAELARVRSHLAQCTRCQADAAWQEEVRSAAPPAAPAPGAQVDRQWLALLRQIADQDDPSARVRTSLREWLRARWLPLTLAAQGALTVAVLAAVVMGAAPREENFQALGSQASVADANALVVFRPGATEAQIRRALRANDAQLVGGPTASDAYLLNVPEPSGETIDRLRAEAIVLRAESLEGDAR
jgi:anti-sigma factor RsiW